MLQMNLQVREYLGCYGVHASVSEVDEYGSIETVAEAYETFFPHSGDEHDSLHGAIRALVRWCALSE